MTTQTKGSFYADTGPSYDGTNPSSSSNDGEIPIVFIAGTDGSFDTVDLPVSFGFTIKSATLVGDTVGSVVVDVKQCAFADFPASLASICGTTKPTLATQIATQDTTLAGWTKTVIPANSILRFIPSGIIALQRATLTLQITKG